MKKPAIPSVPPADKARMRFDAAVKERLELIGGERAEKIALLPEGATLEQAVTAINRIIAALQ